MASIRDNIRVIIRAETSKSESAVTGFCVMYPEVAEPLVSIQGIMPPSAMRSSAAGTCLSCCSTGTVLRNVLGGRLSTTTLTNL